jgi:gliding motility-associated-like protein
MIVKKNIVLLIITICSIVWKSDAVAQDLGVTASITPNSGCDLTVSEQVSVVILNNSNTLPAFGGSYTLSYTIDGAGLTQENPGAPINPNATSNFTFTQSTDLSQCGSHEIKVWIDHPSDANATNDTITWTIQNDCTVIPGNIIQDMLVCEGTNDTLVLDNWSYGSITDWQYSTDNGATWGNLGVTDTFYVFNNILVETQYQVVIDGGYCPNDISTIATVSVQANPTPGTLDDSDSLCISNASGAIDVVGNSSGAVDWEFSIDDGVTWNSIGNTTTTENFVSLTETTWYRTLIDGGMCPDVYTDTAIIYVEEVTNPGALEKDTLICEGEVVDLLLTNYIGDVQYWLESTDGGSSWTTINETTATITTNPIGSETIYQVVVQNGVCQSDTSNIVTIAILPFPNVDAGADVTILEGDTTTLSGSGGVAGIWLPGDVLSDSTIQTPDAFPMNTTTFTYTVIGANGCFNSDDMTVFVELPYPPFSIKNMITSNNDGYNDTWIIEGVEAFPSTFVAVYNIYGKEIYTNENYQNDWDGTVNGKILPNGTYMYIVIPGGTENKFKGNLTIMGDE